MRICIVGMDPDLEKQCGEILKGLQSGGWELISFPYQESPPKADFYVWHFVPGFFPAGVTAEMMSRVLFVVDPKNLDQFHNVLGSRRASILLKPILPAALEPFLQHAIGKSGLSTGSNGRESRDGYAEDLLQCLLHANLKLQQYDQYRTNFLARAVHDFRAPLTALSGYCGLLTDQRLGTLDHRQIELLSRMQHSVTRLTRLADEMFELSLGHCTKREPDIQAADVEAVISHSIHEITPHADGKQVRIAVQMSPPAQPLMFDAARIEQVLINLLENACKFTSKGGTIEIFGYSVYWNNSLHPRAAGFNGNRSPKSSTSNAYRIDIRDSGCGIPPEHIESIFEEYTSYGGGTDRSGGGLGLAICRMIVNAHRGCIWAESRSAGAQFSILLPFPEPVNSRVGVEMARQVPKSLSA